MKIHIGKLIKEEMEKQGIRPGELANMICVSRTNMYDIFSRNNIDLSLLERIGNALQRNFFAEIASETGMEMGQLPQKDEEKLESLSYLSDVVQLNNDVKDRDALKDVIDEYINTDHRKPLLILDEEYTFGAEEVVQGVVKSTFGKLGAAACPLHLITAAIKAMPNKILIDKIDGQRFATDEELAAHLSTIFQLQQDTKKKFICIMPMKRHGLTDNDFRQIWEEQFFVVFYRFNRHSLLSWAKETNQHPIVVKFIKEHKVQDGMPKEQPVPYDFPTHRAYRQKDWELVSKFINDGYEYDSSQNEPFELIREVLDFHKNGKAVGYRPLPFRRTVMIGLEANGDSLDVNVSLPEDVVAIIAYLYDWAVEGPLKGLNEDDIDEQFFPWLKQQHPKMASVVEDETCKSLAALIAEDIDGVYRSSVKFDQDFEHGTVISDDNEFKYYLGNFPERVS